MEYTPTILPEGTDREVTPRDVIARWGNKSRRGCRTDIFCPRADGKVKYQDENRATHCAMELEDRFGGKPLRAYPCEYSRGKRPHWHLTSKAEWDQANHRPARAYLPTGETLIVYAGPPAPFPWPQSRTVLK